MGYLTLNNFLRDYLIDPVCAPITAMSMYGTANTAHVTRFQLNTQLELKCHKANPLHSPKRAPHSVNDRHTKVPPFLSGTLGV